MGTIAEELASGNVPPRRGAVWAVTVDSTARSYNISKANFGGGTPEASGGRRMEVTLYLQAETNDVYFYFDSATGTALNDATKQAAGSADLAFADAHGAYLPYGWPPFKVRIDRTIDKFITIKTATNPGVLRIWACSESR
jgi:hypothetical protein